MSKVLRISSAIKPKMYYIAGYQSLDVVAAFVLISLAFSPLFLLGDLANDTTLEQ